LVPASTGIGGRNANGSALTGGLLAVEPKSEDLRVFAVPSPLQCPALEYGSSFSRAVEFQASAHRRLFVSGTASIEPGGETVHVGDVDKQIDTTMQVVAAILESRDMDWADVIRGSAYVKHPEDAPAYSRYCAAKSLPDIPVTLTNNAICRDNLLFEIEVDAARQR
jgi:enamine deaminase RidA (YjgF/YER057c/UK114 family)